MATAITYQKRSREEILAWLDRARLRKEAWEQKVQAIFAEEDRQRKEAVDSHYYDIEWK